MNRVTHTIGCLASAIPCFVLVYVLARVWVDPMSVDGGAWVPLAVGLMALEFVVLHSGVFMGTLALKAKTPVKRVGVFAGLAGMYGLFALGFSLSIGTWTIVEIFGFLMAGRFVTLVVAAGEGKEQLVARSATGVVAYIPVVFLTVFVSFPELGVNFQVLEEVYPNRGGGLWEQHPERAIAGAVIYFGIMGLIELWHLISPSAGEPAEVPVS